MVHIGRYNRGHGPRSSDQLPVRPDRTCSIGGTWGRHAAYRARHVHEGSAWALDQAQGSFYSRKWP